VKDGIVVKNNECEEMEDVGTMINFEVPELPGK
jgi:hypothetical protein